MANQTVVHSKSEILLSNKKGQTIDIHNNVGKSQGYMLTEKSPSQNVTHCIIPFM